MNLTVLSAPAGLAGKVPARRRLDRCREDFVRGAAREGALGLCRVSAELCRCGGHAVSLLCLCCTKEPGFRHASVIHDRPH